MMTMMIVGQGQQKLVTNARESFTWHSDWTLSSSTSSLLSFSNGGGIEISRIVKWKIHTKNSTKDKREETYPIQWPAAACSHGGADSDPEGFDYLRKIKNDGVNVPLQEAPR